MGYNCGEISIAYSNWGMFVAILTEALSESPYDFLPPNYSGYDSDATWDDNCQKSLDKLESILNTFDEKFDFRFIDQEEIKQYLLMLRDEYYRCKKDNERITSS